MESTGYIRELEDGEHHIFHIQGSSGWCWIQWWGLEQELLCDDNGI
jgi:hypothetical protein